MNMKKIFFVLVTILFFTVAQNGFAGTSTNTETEVDVDSYQGQGQVQSQIGGTQSIVFNSEAADEVSYEYLSNLQPASMNLYTPYAPPVFLNENRKQLPGLRVYRYDELDHDFDELMKKFKKDKIRIQYTEKYKTLPKNPDPVLTAPQMPVGSNDVRLMAIIGEPPANSLAEEVARRIVSLAKIITQTRRIYLEAEVEVFTNSVSTAGGASPAISSAQKITQSLAAVISMIKAETGTRAFKISKIIVYCYNDGPAPALKIKPKQANIKELIFFNANGINPDGAALNLNKKLLAEKLNFLVANNYKIRFLGVGSAEENGLTEEMAKNVMEEVGLSLSEAELNLVLDNKLFQYQAKTAGNQDIELMNKYNSKGYVVLQAVK